MASILIPVRNEEATIEATLRDIVNQEYPKDLMEIIVVDDFSEDRTRNCIDKINDKRLTVLNLKDCYEEGQLQAPKKQALAFAISKAKGTLIVTTDGDCRMNPQWLPCIVSSYENYDAKLLAGPVLYQSTNSFLNIFQSVDLLSMMGITAASITNRLPMMCNGANLAFERKAFYEVGGYGDNTDTATGDDVFLMLKMNRKYPGRVQFLKAQEAVVLTNPQPTWQAFFHQRKRWGSKTTKYGDWRVTFILTLTYLFNLAIIIDIIVGLFLSHFILSAGLAALFIKLIAEGLFLYPVSTYFNQKSLLWRLVPVQVIHIAYVVILGLTANIGTFYWKGRRLQ